MYAVYAYIQYIHAMCASSPLSYKKILKLENPNFKESVLYDAAISFGKFFLS